MDIELQNLIKPGEFTFCGRCGKVCSLGKRDFWCTCCCEGPLGLFTKKMTPKERIEQRMKIECEQECGRIVREHRQALAEFRRDYNG